MLGDHAESVFWNALAIIIIVCLIIVILDVTTRWWKDR